MVLDLNGHKIGIVGYLTPETMVRRGTLQFVSKESKNNKNSLGIFSSDSRHLYRVNNNLNKIQGMSSTENLEILDEISQLQAEAKSLKSKGVNFIIGLGHAGLPRDKEIAKEVEDVDLIIGGHSHSLLYNPQGK